jgi:hypothetical protein
MSLHFLYVREVRQVLTLLAVGTALASIFAPPDSWLGWWSVHADYVAVFFLLLGLFFLTINQIRLLFVSFGCCTAICFYLNERATRAPHPSSETAPLEWIRPIAKPVAEPVDSTTASPLNSQ